MFLGAILIVVYSSFPDPVKLGWLFSIGFLATSGETMTLCFGTRPEGELLAAWLCGLLLLESGRLNGWKRRRLFAGAFFLTWASGLHYYAGPAFLGVLVYVVWAIRSCGWKHGKPIVASIIVGGCLFGIPYLAFCILPYFKDIRAAIEVNQGAGGIGLSIQRHMEMYRSWVHHIQYPALIQKAMSLGIPLWVMSTAMLAAVSSTRGVALAALPLQLGLFLFAWHKMPYYMVHESVLFGGAIAVSTLVLCHFLITRFLPVLSRVYLPAAVAVLSFVLIFRSPMLAQAALSGKERLHETEVAQAAGRRIMGPHARVGGRWGSWYSAGAEHWYDVESDLNTNFTLLDPATYFANVDAFEACFEPKERNILYDWFADGKLKLRGFYIGQSNVALRCLQLSVQGQSKLVGYAEWNDQLFRFQADAAGTYYVVSEVCPIGGGDDWHNPWIGSFSVPLGLQPDPSGTPRWIVTALVPGDYIAPSGRVGQGCREVARTRGKLVRDDRRALVEWARRNDVPVHFYRGIDDLPGFAGVGVPPEATAPSGALRVEGVVNLQEIEAINGASLRRTPDFQVDTVPLPGGFSARVPLHGAEALNCPCWVELKIRVRNGRVGFAVAADEGRVIEHTLGIVPSPAPQVVALKVQDLRGARNVIVFNQNGYPAKADILDAAVLAPPSGAERAR
jgi:hypothetical protein